MELGTLQKSTSSKMSKHIPSFRSYYNAFGQNGHKKGLSNGDHLEVVEAQPDIKILPQLLPGEVVIARAQGVHVFQPLSTNNQGQIGELYVTNFKLSFQTITFPEYRRSHYADLQDFWHPWSRGLIDIPLASIAGLFRVAKNGRRKPLKIGPLKKIVVVTKNFRIETFSFLQSSSTDSHGVASALAGYVFPVEKERLFVFSQESSAKEKESPMRAQHVQFSVRNDWIVELSRLSCRTDDWRISQANEDFHLCQNLPKCFVVPAAVGDDSQLETLCVQLTATDDRRPCIWCWSSPVTGSALCRMSSDSPDETMSRAVQQMHPKKHPPRIMDVSIFCPSVKDLKKSFELWRDAFLVESTTALESSDDKWFSEMDSSKWMQNISRCLELTRMSMLEIEQGVSVILKEPGDRDLNCVMSALIQLCLDPSSRTLIGFQRLIEKEFVALGHRFQERLGLVRTDPEKEAPVFLFFLDCVFQLTVQYPASFEFTDVYLILLYDSSLMGAFRTFSMNCQRDFLSSRKGATSTAYPSAWQLDLTAKQNLTNRLYHSFDLLNRLSTTVPIIAAASPVTENLTPNSVIPFLTVWKHCYFRFIPPLALRGGIEQKMDKFIYRACDELESLCREIGMGSGGMAVIREEDGVSVDGDGQDSRGDEMRNEVIRRRADLVRPFTAHTAVASQSLMTFQK
ncbi:Myotubularin-related protein 10-B [Hypsibius exemplaris]|uniref:Myotubularin-related protein 10-B n=1 Tax=Hypsibius exemplaris TaxID=2072580 RepID=A0A1W0WTC6_HYPEX|nr:Myotubularin-related protein 10-B [Hypsibius exemplaris]